MQGCYSSRIFIPQGKEINTENLEKYRRPEAHESERAEHRESASIGAIAFGIIGIAYLLMPVIEKAML